MVDIVPVGIVKFPIPAQFTKFRRLLFPLFYIARTYGAGFAAYLESYLSLVLIIRGVNRSGAPPMVFESRISIVL